MLDLHTHVLPGVDDGPADLEGSVAMAVAAVEAGTTVMAATPHVSWDIPTSAATVARGVRELQAALDEAGVAIRLRTGGEVAVTRGAELPAEELRRLHLGGGEWLLAECPLSASGTGFDGLLLHLQGRGHRILLAHPERSPVLQRSPDTLRRLVDAGMLCSITAASLTGGFGSTVKRFAQEMVTEGLVHNVASDTHDARRRPPGMRDELVAASDELPGIADHVDWWCVDVPRAILDGGPVPAAPGPPPSRPRRRLPRWPRRR